jgi:hypothetical protein
MRFSTSVFFLQVNQVFPRLLSKGYVNITLGIQLGPFRIFTKIPRDSRGSEDKEYKEDNS